jgi:ribonuclease R
MRPMEATVPLSDEIEIRPQHYQRLVEKIAGKAEERILSYLMLRSLRQARYAAEPLGHFALATNEYTHFT